MLKLVVVFLSLWVAYSLCNAGVVENNTIPSYIQVCKISDPNLNECIVGSVEKIKPYLAKGIEELMIPSCNPLKLKEDIIMELSTGPNVITIVYKNVTIQGLDDFYLTAFVIDPDNDRLNVSLRILSLESAGEMDIQGKLAGLHLTGNGPSQGMYSDVNAHASITFERFRKDDDEEYLKVKDIALKILVDSVHLGLEEVFHGDLETFIAQFLDQNEEAITAEVTPILEKAVSNMIEKLTNNIFNKFPLKKLLPD